MKGLILANLSSQINFAMLARFKFLNISPNLLCVRKSEKRKRKRKKQEKHGAHLT